MIAQKDRTYLKPMMSIVRWACEDDKEKLHEAIGELAVALRENGEDELAEYVLAQTGFGAWVVDNGK